MPASIKTNIWARELKYRIDSLFVGGVAPAFTQPDTSGKKVSLASFRGKYVLLDFWASWCMPCRAENPNLVKAMQKIGDKDFTIVSISFDDERQNWLSAIKRDRLNWTHLSTLQGEDNPLAAKYYIVTIPSNYLIGPDGTIIAKDLFGNDLVLVLEKIFK